MLGKKTIMNPIIRKKATILISFICFMLFSFELFAQGKAHISSPQLAGEIYVHKQDYAGSQFFNDIWLKGDVFLSNGEIVEQQLLKYNMFIDELIWQEPFTNREVKVDKNLISSFTLEAASHTETIEFVHWQGAFVQRLVKGSISLYVRRKMLPSSRLQSVHVGGRSHLQILLIPNNTYFLLKGSSNEVNVSLNRRSVRRAIHSVCSDSECNLQKGRLRAKTEQNLVSIIKHLQIPGE